MFIFFLHFLLCHTIGHSQIFICQLPICVLLIWRVIPDDLLRVGLGCRSDIRLMNECVRVMGTLACANLIAKS